MIQIGPRRMTLVVLLVALLFSCGNVRFPQNDRGDAGVDAAVGSAAAAAVRGRGATLSPDEIHTVHAPYGIPTGAPRSNDLIFRHSYTASTNDRTRFADWVAYAIRAEWTEDSGTPSRSYVTDPVLDESETLEARDPDDYEGAHAAYRYDRGHLVPLASFESSPFVDEVNYLSVLVPQLDSLNRGPWASLENRVRRLAARARVIYVVAGTLYERDEPMPLLPGADEAHVVPVAFWMVVHTGPDSVAPAEDARFDANDAHSEIAYPRAAAFIVPQRPPADHEITDFLTSVDGVEAATGLDLLSLLDDLTEDAVESAVSAGWFLSW